MWISFILTGIVLVGLGQPAASQEWAIFVEPTMGTSLELPNGVFTIHEGLSSRGVGTQYKTSDGRAVLQVYSQKNSQRDTPTDYLRQNYKVPPEAIDYWRVTRFFFAVSAVSEGMIFYSRCNFSRAPGGAIHCFDLKYPEREKRAWDDIVTRISRSLRPLERG
jgi:hypothetical protein